MTLTPESKNRILPKCDIVLPVFNALSNVRECIDSIQCCTGDLPFRLYIIDDCGDAFTYAYLKKVTRNDSIIHLHRNPENFGFVKSINIGISMGESPYVVLVNSDVIVTPGWLRRLLDCAESDPRIGSVNPLTNHAANIAIPIVPGANFYGMDEFLSENSPKNYPDVVTGVGFCMLLRRSALREVGLFDEVYGKGYCEESDLCMRLTAHGYRTVVCDDVYVYHKGGGTFSDRNERYRRNRRIFEDRWSKDYRRQYSAFLRENPFRAIRSLCLPQVRRDPLSSVQHTYVKTRAEFYKGNYFRAGYEILKGVRRAYRSKRPVVSPELVSRFTRSERLRVTYFLNSLDVSGGVLSVVQLVNELILLGVEARIAALREDPEIHGWKFLCAPMVFRDYADAVRNFPETDILVATHWTTAPLVAKLVEASKASLSVYFIQDYEAWFIPESNQEKRSKVKHTYSLIQNKIVKSEWLKALLANDGFDAHKIHLGMDLGVFYPRDVKNQFHPRVLAMARPKTPWRGFSRIVEALKEVKARIPELEIMFFGEDLDPKFIPFAFKNEGVITSRERLAELYSSSDVFLDASDFQGFGRTGLEAMACGAACVLTNVGGVNEYARDGENCLLVTPGRPTALAEAVLSLLGDPVLKARLVHGGLSTAEKFCHRREAKETLQFFREIVDESRPEGEIRVAQKVAL